MAITLNSNLAPSFIGTDRVLRRDLTTGAYDWVLDVGGQPIATAPNRYANLSSDGRYLALVTNTQIDPIDSEGGFDLMSTILIPARVAQCARPVCRRTSVVRCRQSRSVVMVRY